MPFLGRHHQYRASPFCRSMRFLCVTDSHHKKKAMMCMCCMCVQVPSRIVEIMCMHYRYTTGALRHYCCRATVHYDTSTVYTWAIAMVIQEQEEQECYSYKKRQTTYNINNRMSTTRPDKKYDTRSNIQIVQLRYCCIIAGVSGLASLLFCLGFLSVIK